MHSFFLIRQHAWAILFVLVFKALQLTNCLFCFPFVVTWNTNIAEWVQVLLHFCKFFMTFGLLWMHDRPNLSLTPTTYNRKAQNIHERWKDCFWSNISNNTLLWNEVNLALPSPSIPCLYLFKHRPPKFRDCDRRHSQTCLTIIAHLFIETNV